MGNSNYAYQCRRESKFAVWLAAFEPTKNPIIIFICGPRKSQLICYLALAGKSKLIIVSCGTHVRSPCRNRQVNMKILTRYSRHSNYAWVCRFINYGFQFNFERCLNETSKLACRELTLIRMNRLKCSYSTTSSKNFYYRAILINFSTKNQFKLISSLLKKFLICGKLNTNMMKQQSNILYGT